MQIAGPNKCAKSARQPKMTPKHIIAFYFGTQSQKVSNFLQNYTEKVYCLQTKINEDMGLFDAQIKQNEKIIEKMKFGVRINGVGGNCAGTPSFMTFSLVTIAHAANLMTLTISVPPLQWVRIALVAF